MFVFLGGSAAHHRQQESRADAYGGAGEFQRTTGGDPQPSPPRLWQTMNPPGEAEKFSPGITGKRKARNRNGSGLFTAIL